MAKIIHRVITTSRPQIKKKVDLLVAPKACEYQWYKNNVPVSKEKGGNSRKIKFETQATYNVSLKMSKEINNRMISEKISV